MINDRRFTHTWDIHKPTENTYSRTKDNVTDNMQFLNKINMFELKWNFLKMETY